MSFDVKNMTLCKAAEGLRKKEFSSVELTQSLLGDITKDIEKSRKGEVDALGAFLSVDVDGALKQAQAADEARAKGQGGDLLGIPLAIKDLINVKGQPCTCASTILEGYVAPYDASVIKRLRADGTVFAGRTNMDEFAMGSTNENSAYWPVRNPVAHDRVAGGSSGGSAAAVASGMAIAALGSDTGGSIRQPASFCGCVGMKPSYGRVSRSGAAAFASSLDQIGPVTKNVEDAAVLLSALAGKDDWDQTTLDIPVPDYRAALKSASMKGLRIGLPKEYFVEGVDRDVMARVREAVDACAKNGAEIVDVSLPHTEYAVSVYFICSTAEASANLARLDGVRYGKRAVSDTVQDMYVKTRTEGFGEEVKRRLLLGTYVLCSGYYDAYYTRALKVRTLIRRDFEDVFKKVDVVMSPVCPAPAYKLGMGETDPMRIYLGDMFTVATNLAGLCGLSVPCGVTSEKLPVGLQIIGPSMGEETLLKAAYAFEQI